MLFQCRASVQLQKLQLNWFYHIIHPQIIILQSITIVMDEHFCYLYILQQSEAWTGTPLLAIGLCLLVFTIIQLRRNVDKMNVIIKLTYISIICSLLIYLLKLILSQVVFWVEFNSEYDMENNEKYLTASKYEFVIDCVGIFAMQTTILLVPANWLKNVSFIFREFSNRNQLQEQEKKQFESAISFQQCSIKILIGYFVIRLISLVGLLIPFIIINDQQSLNIVVIIILAWWQLESLLLLIMLTLGLISVKQNKKLKQILEESDYYLMIKHYFLLIGCTLLRLVTDGMFTVYYFQNLSTKPVCFIEKGVSIFGAINILLEGLLTLYLSVFLILRIYKPEDIALHEVDSFIAGEDLATTRQKRNKLKIEFVGQRFKA